MNARNRFRNTLLFAGLLWLSAVLTLLSRPRWPLGPGQHPSHEVLVSVVRYQHRIFHVVRLPRCEHLEAVITNEPSGETLAQAKQRMGGVASIPAPSMTPTASLSPISSSATAPSNPAPPPAAGCSSSPPTASSTSPATTRSTKASPASPRWPWASASSPSTATASTTSCMKRRTERMAIGLTKEDIYLVEANTDIPRLAAFMKNKLKVEIALNSDGGHVVHGNAPVHLIFRWRRSPSHTILAQTPPGEARIPAALCTPATSPQLAAHPDRRPASG